MLEWRVMWTKVVWGIPEEWKEKYYAYNIVPFFSKFKIVNISLFKKSSRGGESGGLQILILKSCL